VSVSRRPALLLALLFAAGSSALLFAQGNPPVPIAGARDLYRSDHATEIAAESIACRARGGTMAYRGRTIEPVCVIQTRDAGKTCSASAECEGRCLIDIDKAKDEEWRSIAVGSTATGICSAEELHFGCYIPIERGTAGHPVCAD
jgi:hypothetical protein